MNKTHGLQQIVDLKASVNWGLNDVLKTACNGSFIVRIEKSNTILIKQVFEYVYDLI